MIAFSKRDVYGAAAANGSSSFSEKQEKKTHQKRATLSMAAPMAQLAKRGEAQNSVKKLHNYMGHPTSKRLDDKKKVSPDD
jgi:hypothetical protein